MNGNKQNTKAKRSMWMGCSGVRNVDGRGTEREKDKN